jgi:valyl-tRNA synthetase
VIASLKLAEGDLCAVGRIEKLELIGGGSELTVENVQFAPLED